MTPEQIRIAVLNTQRKPRNHAPVIYQAIQNDEAQAVTSDLSFYVSNYEVRRVWTKRILAQ